MRSLFARDASASRLAALQFVVSAAAVLAVIGTAGVLALRRVAREEALRDATQLTRSVSASVVGPAVGRDLVDGHPDALARLDRLAADGLIGDRIVRLKLWTLDGRLVYADEHALMRTAIRPNPELLEAARSGEVRAEVSSLEEEENGFERGNGDLLEVYAPVTAADGTRFVIETYQRTEQLGQASTALWRSFLPVLVLALLALALAQLPLAWWYGRLTRREARARADLILTADRAREDERRRIAADLHDSVVQDLAGVAFDLAATADQIDRRDRDDVVATMRRGADVSRASIAQLRTLLVQLYPGQPSSLDLTRALPDLAADLNERGVRVDVQVEPIALDDERRSLLYRAALEAVRNVARHASATRATISLTATDGAATLYVEDNGQGMTSRDLAAQRAAGHVGLTLLAERVRTQNGELTISSEPGRGTRLAVWLPLAPAGD